MTDSASLEFDLQALCAEVLREYEEVIETIIRRPVRSRAGVEPAPGAGARALDGALSSEPT